MGSAGPINDPVVRAPRAGWRRAARVTAWTLTALALFAYARLFQGTYIDDTYITLMYVRNLADHLAWGFFPGEMTNTATSPLNVVVLAVVASVSGSALSAVAIAMAIEWTLTLAILMSISRSMTDSARAGVVIFAMLATNPLLLSSIGLEGSLYVLLLLATLALLLTGRHTSLAVVAGLLVLTRPEGLLVLFAVLALARIDWRTRVRIVVIFGLTILPWYLFSWVVLGSAIPDTLVIKLNQQPWAGTTLFGNGPLLYLDRLPAATLGSLWPLVLAPLAIPVLRRATPLVRRALAVLVVSAVAHYVGYAALAVPPFHWYYTHEVVAIAVVGGIGFADLLGRLTARAGRAGPGIAWATAALPAATFVTLLVGPGGPFSQAAIHSNWARPGQYEAIAAELRAEVPPDATIDFRGEVGTLSYYSERRLLDTFTDRARADREIDRLRDGQAGVVGWLLDLNFVWRDDAPTAPVPTFVIDFGAPRVPPDVDPTGDPAYVDAWITWSRWVPFNRIVLRRLAEG